MPAGTNRCERTPAGINRKEIDFMEKFIMNTRIFMGHRCCEEIRNFEMQRASNIRW